MTLTDRIAKKLYELNEVRACGRVRVQWDRLDVFNEGGDFNRDKWRGEAREVLGAMREPGDALIEAAGRTDLGMLWDLKGEDVPVAEIVDFDAAWKAMIDAALAEGEGK